MSEKYLSRVECIGTELNQIRIQSKLSDLTFVCQESDLSFHTISGHQAIFSNLSKLLAKFFAIAADKQPYENVVIMLDSIDYNVMKKLMQYVYEGETRINKHEGIKLLELCQLLQLEVPLSSFKTQEAFDLDSEDCLGTFTKEFKNNDFCSSMGEANDELSTSVEDDRSLNFDDLRSDQANVRIKPMATDSIQMSDLIAVDNDVRIETTELNSNRKIKRLINKKARSQATFSKYFKSSTFASSETCKFCGVIFRKSSTYPYRNHTESRLKSHIKYEHDNIGRFECQKCEFSGPGKVRLERHIEAIHNKIEGLKCDLCQYTTAYKASLKTHIKTIHK